MRWTSARKGAGTLAAVLMAGLGAFGLAQQPTPAEAAPAEAAPAGPAPAATAPAAPETVARFVVVLDAAHGGDDNGGKLNSGYLEKQAALALSVRLRSLLTARGIRVVTTRESDDSVSFDQRATIANRARAQACISLHVAETGDGVHLFASNLPPAQPVRFAPWKTAQAPFVTRSMALLGNLNQALLHAGVPVTLGRTALPGVDSMMCPAVAIELAPERDAEKKTTAEPDDADYQARVANVLANALLEWRTEGRQP